MLTDLPSSLITPTNLPSFPNAQFTNRVNPVSSFDMYASYRELAQELIDTNSAEIFYRVYHNAEGSFNGEGVHEKFIYRGQSVLDVSMGLLDYPWFAADGNPLNEITLQQLHQLANVETTPIVAWRLRQMANFANLLPTYTRYYHYVGQDGVRAVTLCDEFNSIKMNCIVSHVEEDGPIF